MRIIHSANESQKENEIPPTAVGGSFNSNLHQTPFSLESHRRKSVDCSSPAYSGIARPESYGIRLYCRLDMNHPPTSVGGIPVEKCTWLELNDPPTTVGGWSLAILRRYVRHTQQGACCTSLPLRRRAWVGFRSLSEICCRIDDAHFLHSFMRKASSGLCFTFSQ